jgi:hypothetical protein
MSLHVKSFKLKMLVSFSDLSFFKLMVFIIFALFSSVLVEPYDKRVSQ